MLQQNVLMHASKDSMAAFEAGLILGNNTIFAPHGQVTIKCGGQTVNFTEFQRNGFDQSSRTVGDGGRTSPPFHIT